MSVAKPHEAVEWALAYGGEGTVALARVVSQADIRWANSMLTTNGERSTTTLTVVSTQPVRGGTGVGAATGPVRGRSDAHELARHARDTASRSSAAPDAEPLVSGSASDAPDWTDAAERTSGSDLRGLATHLSEVFTNGTADGIEHFGFAENDVTSVYLGSATGLRRRHVQPTARIEATAKSHARTRSAWTGRSARSVSDIDIRGVDVELRRGLGWQQRQIDVSPGRHDAVLTASATADLMVYLMWSASERDAREGRTVFSRPGGATRIGEQLTSAPITLSSDPRDIELACVPFCTSTWSSSTSSAFDIGMALSRTDWMANGSLEHLISTRSVAAERGTAPHPLIDNLRLVHADGHGSLDDLVARTSHGLLINSLWYIRQVDSRSLLLTGLTRDGVYVVRDGEVVGSAGNYRFNSSPVDLLSTVRDASATSVALPREFADYFTRAAMPALSVGELNLSTRSDAL